MSHERPIRGLLETSSRTVFPLLRGLPILAWLLALVPLLRHGLCEGHDWLLEVVRVAQYRAALLEGSFPPSWADDLYGGYGSPIFVFYAPLFVALSSFASWVAGSLTSGMAWVLGLASGLGGASIYLLARQILAEEKPRVAEAGARLATAFFVLSPYLLGNRDLRNAHAEFLALQLAPVALLGLTLALRRNVYGPPLLTLGLALVVLAHNLTALVVLTFLLLGCSLAWIDRRSKAEAVRADSLPTLLSALSLALTATAFFWIPALHYGSWMRREELLKGKFDFHNQFPPLQQFFGLEEFFGVGPLPILLLAVAGFFGLRSPTDDPLRRCVERALIALGLVFIFLTHPMSTFVWEQMPFLPLFQFPWRWAGPLTLVTALLTATTWAHLARHLPNRLMKGLEVFFFLVLSAQALPHLHRVQPIAPEIRQQLATSMESQNLRRLGVTSTVLDEYLPSSARPDLWRRKPAWQGPLLNEHQLGRVDVQEAPHRLRLQTRDVKQEIVVPLRRWNFPGWRARTGNQVLDVLQGPGGVVALRLPSGDREVELRHVGPPLRRKLLPVSALAWILWFLLLGRAWKASTRLRN